MYLHNLPSLCNQFSIPPAWVSPKMPHILASALTLTTPGAIIWAADAAVGLYETWGGGERAFARPFLQTGYAYLPLVWGSTLAFYLDNLLERGGTLLQVSLLLVLAVCQCVWRHC